MRSRIALFPGGSAGAGLLLLRVSVAVSTLMLTAACIRASYIPHFLGVLVAIGLCGGLQTRILAVVGSLASLACLMAASPPLGLAAVHTISAIALAFTGAGAFSLDARLFGRRTVTLPDPDDTIV
jgi:hypothetical protein